MRVFPLAALTVLLALPAAASAEAEARLSVSKIGYQSWTNDTTPTISGTAYDTPEADTEILVEIVGAEEFAGLAERTGSTWSIETGDALPEGKYEVRAQQYHSDGLSFASTDLNVDITPPTAPMTITGAGTAPDGSAQVKNPFTVTVAPSEPVLGMACSLDGAAFSPCPFFTTMSNSFVFVVPGGRHTLRARAHDRAGNVGVVAEQAVTFHAPVKPAFALPPLPKPASNKVFGTNRTPVLLRLPGKLKVSRAGRLTVPVSSGVGFATRGTIQIRTVRKHRTRTKGKAVRRHVLLAQRRNFRIPKGVVSKHALTLPAAARALLRREGRMKVKVSLTVKDPVGDARTVTATHTIAAPR